MSDRYFARIGIPAPTTPDLAALRAIVGAHTRSIAFENISSFTGRDVDITPAAVAAKLVDGRRGGYCFEQNTLLRGVLDELGYRTTGLSARVVWGSPVDAPTAPLTHMLLRVDLPEGPHVVDVGFGGQTLTGVLALEPDVEQATPHEPYRLVVTDGIHELQTLVAGAWRPLYRFDLTATPPVDYEVANFYVSRHPRSGFVTNLVAARVDTDRRYAYGGHSLAVHHLGGPSERRDLDSPAEIRDVLERDLLIDTSGVEDLEKDLARLF